VISVMNLPNADHYGSMVLSVGPVKSSATKINNSQRFKHGHQPDLNKTGTSDTPFCLYITKIIKNMFKFKFK